MMQNSKIAIGYYFTLLVKLLGLGISANKNAVFKNHWKYFVFITNEGFHLVQELLFVFEQKLVAIHIQCGHAFILQKHLCFGAI